MTIIRSLALFSVIALSAACSPPPPAELPVTDDMAPGAAMPAGSPDSGTASTSNAAPGMTAAPGGTAAPRATAAPSSTAATAAPSSAAAPAAAPKPAAPTMREVTVPASTALEIILETPVASDTSQVEDTVRGKLGRAVVIDEMTVIPAGSTITGTVVEASPSGKIKGRASLAIRFNRVVIENTPYTIQTARIGREAEGTKAEDAKKIGIGAGAGAVIGAIAGGKKGAAIGTAVGGGAGTGVVLATKGDEVGIGAGTTVRTTVTDAVKITVRM